MATRVTSTRFVGRAAELAELSAALEASAAGKPSLALVAGESGVGKSRLAERADPHRARGGRARAERRLRRAGRGRAALRAARGRAAARRARGRPRLRRAARRASAPTSPRSSPCSASGAREEGAGAEQVRVFEALLALFDAMSERAAAAARDRGPALGRQLHARLRALPRPHALHGAHPGGRHLPLRRAAPAPSAAAAAGRAGARPAGAPGRARAPHPRRDGRAARGHPRQPRRPGTGRAPLLAQRGQPAVHRGAAGRRARRARDAAADAARRADAARGAAVGAGAGGAALAGVPVARRRPARASSPASTPPSCARGCARRSAARSWSRTPTAATASATRCCARWSTTTCCRASAPSCTGRSRARWSARSTQEGERVHLTAEVAHHWLAAGDQPAALAASVRAAAAAERVNAFHEALSLRERALGLWDRVPDPEQVAGLSQVDLLDAGRQRRRRDRRRGPPGDAAAAHARAGRRGLRAAPRRRPCSSGSRGRSGA